MISRLLCPVRGCFQPLSVDARRGTCGNAHSFDRSKRGVLNLLQPQDSRSRSPGDSKEVALARRRNAERGLAELVHSRLSDLLEAASIDGPVLDVGCGEGSFLRFLRRRGVERRGGVDISAVALDLAAREDRDALFVVANADRALPWAEQSLGALVTINARVNPQEFARVAQRRAIILVATPSPDDLAELREVLQGRALERDKFGPIEEDLAPFFSLSHRETIRSTKDVDESALRDLLSLTYRGARGAAQSRLATLRPMKVTLGWDIGMFRRRAA